jgi:hypothetical protein
MKLADLIYCKLTVQNFVTEFEDGVSRGSYIWWCVYWLALWSVIIAESSFISVAYLTIYNYLRTLYNVDWRIRITYELETAARDAFSIPVITYTWRTEMKNFFGQSTFSVCCENK